MTKYTFTIDILMHSALPLSSKHQKHLLKCLLHPLKIRALNNTFHSKPRTVKTPQNMCGYPGREGVGEWGRELEEPKGRRRRSTCVKSSKRILSTDFKVLIHPICRVHASLHTYTAYQQQWDTCFTNSHLKVTWTMILKSGLHRESCVLWLTGDWFSLWTCS